MSPLRPFLSRTGLRASSHLTRPVALTRPFHSTPARMGLTAEQQQIIKATVPVLIEHGETITRKFYGNMLGAHPELKTIFNHANQVNHHQPRALAGALFAYASNIDNLGALGPAVELMAAKHASLYVRPEQYQIVGENLLGAMKEILGDALTPEIHDAWAAAYWQLADVLIKREGELYDGASGWRDWRDMKIAKKVKEGDEITSFYLEPVNGEALPSFLPGQFISVQMDVPALNHRQSRQYSLSDAPQKDGKYYRISVKREQGLDALNPSATAHPGYISNILHDLKNEGDVIQVSHPFGDFFLDATKESSAPIVLMGGGVGLTCLMSILNTVVSQGAQRKISWVHAARYKSVRAFTEYVRELANTNENITAKFFDQNPTSDEVEGQDYDFQGLMDLSKLDKEKDLFINDKSTEYFVCGPTGFMLSVSGALRNFGVPEERIHMELFGTGGVPKN